MLTMNMGIIMQSLKILNLMVSEQKKMLFPMRTYVNYLPLIHAQAETKSGILMNYLTYWTG